MTLPTIPIATTVFYVVLHAVLEVVYFSVSMPLHRRNIAQIQGGGRTTTKPLVTKFIALTLVYIVFLSCVWYFVVREIIEGAVRTATEAVINASVLALGIFGVYNITNFLAFDNFSVRAGLVDLAWGLVSLNVVALACLAFAGFLRRRRRLGDVV